MIKTYILTRPYHNYSFILTNKSGMKLRYDFTNGNSATGSKARLILRGQYAQDLLEQSEEFKTGFVKLERATEGGEAPVPVQPDSVTEVPEVDSPEKLIEFVATSLEKVYKQPKPALDYAQKKGYSFPNLTLE